MKYATLSLREFHGINFDGLNGWVRLDRFDGLDGYARFKCWERSVRYHGSIRSG